MKGSAIVRIILWSFVLILLLGIFVVQLLNAYQPPEEAQIILEDTARETIVISQSAPDTTPTTAQTAETMPAETVPAATVAATLDTTPGSIGNNYTISADQVQEIDIQWVAGDITIQSGTGTDIVIQEEGEYSSLYTMYVLPKRDELSISYLPTEMKSLHLDPDAPAEKNLTITIPQSWTRGKIEVSNASGEVSVQGLTIQEFDLEGGNSSTVFTDCTIESLDLATASGDVSYTGSLNELEWVAASGSLNAVFTNVPREIDLESFSGTMDITLPANAGFTIESEGLVKNFTTDFDVSQKNGRMVSGNGQCKIDMEALSSNLTIRKG